MCGKDNHQIKDCRKFLGCTHSDKWQIVREKRLCSMCLQHSRETRCKNSGKCMIKNSGKCMINGCVRKHDQLLHNSSADTPFTSVVDQSYTHQQSESSILFRIVPITLYNNDTSINTYAFLDEGSSLTLIEAELADELGLQGEPESLCLKWTVDIVRNENQSRKVSLHISGASKNVLTC